MRWSEQEYAAFVARQQAIREPQTPLCLTDELHSLSYQCRILWEPILLILPYPMSVNAYWCHSGGKRILTKAAKHFRQAIADAIETQWQDEWPRPLDGRLGLTLTLYPPDHRVRDLDNTLKPLLDALEHARVYANDGQIDALHVLRKQVTVPSRADVAIEPWKGKVHE